MAQVSLKDDLTVPGTTIIVDETTEVTGNDNFKLVPTPSTHPDDPLNWSPARKWLQLFCLILWVLAGTFANGSLYPIYDVLSSKTGLTLAEINSGVGYLYLFQQIFSLITQPLAIAIGKRPVFLATCAGLCIFPFTLSQVHNNSQWIGLIIVNSIFTSPVYVLPETALSNVFFYHERAFPFGIFVASIWGGPLLAPVLSGFIYTRFGINGPTYFAGGFAALVTVFLWVFLEETNFDRDMPHEPPDPVLTVDGDAPAASVYVVEKPKTDDTTRVEEVVSSTESKQEGPAAPDDNSHSYGRTTTPWPGPHPFKLFTVSPYSFGILWRGVFQSLAILRLPIILWVGLAMAFTQIYYNTMAALSSGILSAPPYNFVPNMVGLTFLSPLVAIVPGAIFAGWITDRCTIRQARRRGGVSEPEDKLILFIIPAILNPVGCLMMGLGSYYGAHWIVFVLGEFVVTVAGPLVNLLAITYTFDAFHSLHPTERRGPRAGVQPAAVYVLAPTLLAMAITFGFNYAITPWAFDAGFRTWGVSAAGVGLGITLTGLIMMRFGKRFRKSGAGYYRRVINI